MCQRTTHGWYALESAGVLAALCKGRFTIAGRRVEHESFGRQLKAAERGRRTMKSSERAPKTFSLFLNHLLPSTLSSPPRHRPIQPPRSLQLSIFPFRIRRGYPWPFQPCIFQWSAASIF